jgi:murein DD-endopeptidase MepM/ murein hydrolase activator NlpD
VVLTVRTSSPVASVQVQAFEKELQAFAVDRMTWQVLIGIDLSTSVGTHNVTIATQPDSERRVHPLVVKPRHFPSRTLKVDPAFVTPPKEAAERIARETRRLNEIWASSTTERLWRGAFVTPVPHPANSAFGSRSVFNGQPRSQHSGADFGSPAGTPIKAPNAARVVLAEDLYFSGGTVVLDHGRGLFSLFAHLSTIDAQQGAVVEAGEVIGRVGATGRVTGPHLHWAVRANGSRVDPLSLLAVLGEEASHNP